MRQGSDRAVAVMPFFHIYGLNVILTQSLRQGVQLVTLPQFQPESFFQTMQDYKVRGIVQNKSRKSKSTIRFVANLAKLEGRI